MTTVCAWASLLKVHFSLIQAYRSFRNTNRGHPSFPLANLLDVSFGKELSKCNTNFFPGYNGSSCMLYLSHG